MTTASSILEGMTRVYPEKSIFMTIRNTTINFSKTAYELLGKPDGVEIYCGGGKVAVKAGGDFRFTKSRTGKQNLYRICGSQMINTVKTEVGDGRVLGEPVDGILLFG